MKFKHLIFDLDGTLWDITPASVQGMNYGLVKMGLGKHQTTLSKVQAVTGRPVDECYQTLFPELSALELTQMEQHEDEFLHTADLNLYPQVETTLERLSETGVQLYLISNCGKDYLNNFFERSGLKPLFTDWDCYGSAQVPKGEMIQNMIQLHDLKSVAYVGDTSTDQEACHFAKCPFIWADYGFGTDIKSTHTIKRFVDILELV